MRWHRDILRHRWAARSRRGKTGRPPAATSRPWSYSWPGRTPNGATARSTGNWPAWESRSRRRPYGRSSRPTASTLRRGGPGRPGRSSCVEAILACDFFSVGLLDGTQVYVLGVIEHATRRIRNGRRCGIWAAAADQRFDRGHEPDTRLSVGRQAVRVRTWLAAITAVTGRCRADPARLRELGLDRVYRRGAPRTAAVRRPATGPPHRGRRVRGAPPASSAPRSRRR